MFFQAVPDPNEERMRQMEERITRAIETGFSKVKLQTSQTQTTSGVKTGGGYASTRSDFDTSKMNIFDPSDYLKGMKEIGTQATSILTDPLKTMNQGLFDIQTSTKGIFEQFGRGREMSSGIARSFMDAKFSIMEMGGGANKVFEILEEAMRATNRTSLAGKENIDDLFAVSQIAGQGVGEMVGAFDRAGMSMFHVKDQMMKAMDYAASIGVNSKEVADKLVGNLEKLNLYNFQGGVQGMAKMAAHATMLRADMNKTLALADELLSPEKAIEMAAGLQRLGVSTSALIDPLKLMDMAQNDPAQLQKEIADLAKQYTYFNEETKKTEILPGAQRYLRELAPLLGMSTQELANMAIQSGTIERKLSEIRMPDIIQSEEEKMMIANLAELNTDGEYVIKYIDKDGEEKTTLVNELNGNREELDRIKKSQEMLSMDPKQVALKQLSAVEETNALLESLGAKLPAEMAATRSTYQVGETMSTAGRLTAKAGYETIRKSTGTTKEDLDRLDKSLMDGLTSFAEELKNGSADIQALFDVIEGSLESFGGKSKDLIDKLKTNEGQEELMTKITEVFKDGGKNVINTAGDALKKAAEDEMKGAGSQFAKMLLQGVIEITGGKKETEEITSPSSQSNITSPPTVNEINNNVDDEFEDGEINIINNKINIKSKPEDSIIVDESTQKTFLGTDLLGQKDNLSTGLTGLDKTIIDYFNREGSSTDILLDQLTASKETNLLIKSMGEKMSTPTASNNITLNPEIVSKFATDLKTKFSEHIKELQKDSNIKTEVSVEMKEEDKKIIQDEKSDISKPIESKVNLTPDKAELDKTVENIKKDQVKIDVSYDTKKDSVVNNIKTIDDLRDHLSEFSKEITFFDEKTKTIQFMPGAEETIKNMASTIKIPIEELKLVSLQAGIIEDKMGKIKFPSLDLNKDDQLMLTKLAELNDKETEYVVNFKTKNGEIIQKPIKDLKSFELEEIKKQQESLQTLEDHTVGFSKNVQSLFNEIKPELQVKLDDTKTKTDSEQLLDDVNKFFTENSLKPKFEIPDQEQQKITKLKFQIENLKEDLKFNPNVDVDQMEGLFSSLKDKYSNISTKVEFEVDANKIEETEKEIKDKEFEKNIKFNPPKIDETLGEFSNEYTKELEELEKLSDLKLQTDIKFTAPDTKQMLGEFSNEYTKELEELEKLSDLKLQTDIKFTPPDTKEMLGEFGDEYTKEIQELEKLSDLKLQTDIKFTPPKMDGMKESFEVYEEEIKNLDLRSTIKFTPPKSEEILGENYSKELEELEKRLKETDMSPNIKMSVDKTDFDKTMDDIKSTETDVKVKPTISETLDDLMNKYFPNTEIGLKTKLDNSLIDKDVDSLKEKLTNEKINSFKIEGQEQMLNFFKEYSYFDEKTKTTKLLPDGEKQLEELSKKFNIPTSTFDSAIESIDEILKRKEKLGEETSSVVNFKIDTDSKDKATETKTEISKPTTSEFSVKINDEKTKSDSEKLLEQVDKFFNENSLKPKLEIPEQEKQKLDKLKFQVDNLKDNLQLNPNIDVKQMDEMFTSLKDKYTKLATKVEFEIDPNKVEEVKKLEEEPIHLNLSTGFKLPEIFEKIDNEFKKDLPLNFQSNVGDLEKEVETTIKKLNEPLSTKVKVEDEPLISLLDKKKKFGEDVITSIKSDDSSLISSLEKKKEMEKPFSIDYEIEDKLLGLSEKKKDLSSPISTEFKLDNKSIFDTVKEKDKLKDGIFSDYKIGQESLSEIKNEKENLNKPISTSFNIDDKSIPDLIKKKEELEKPLSSEFKLDHKSIFDTVKEKDKLKDGIFADYKIGQESLLDADKKKQDLGNPVVTTLNFDDKSIPDLIKKKEELEKPISTEFNLEHKSIFDTVKERDKLKDGIFADYKIGQESLIDVDKKKQHLMGDINTDFKIEPESLEKTKKEVNELGEKTKISFDLKDNELQTLMKSPKSFGFPLDGLNLDGFNGSIEKMNSVFEKQNTKIEIPKIEATEQPKVTPTDTQIGAFSNYDTLSNVSMNSETKVGGEVKIVHELNVNGKDVDKAMLQQTLNDYLKNPVFVNSINNAITQVNNGYGNKVQTNPLQSV